MSAGSCPVAEVRGHPTEPAKLIEHGELGWALYEAPGLPTHRVPTWDIRGHTLCVHSCACKPVWDDICKHYVHRAFDGRDEILTLARRMH